MGRTRTLSTYISSQLTSVVNTFDEHRGRVDGRYVLTLSASAYPRGQQPAAASAADEGGLYVLRRSCSVMVAHRMALASHVHNEWRSARES